jgi:transposase-like protein
MRRMADRELEKVRRSVERMESAREAWEQAIRDAAKTSSLRKIAQVAGVTHETVRTIIRGKDSSAAP